MSFSYCYVHLEYACSFFLQLCQTVRLVPKAYQEFRTLLINEDHKHGGLRLAQARTLIKIDVNKTRKLYDFLVQEGVINKIR